MNHSKFLILILIFFLTSCVSNQRQLIPNKRIIAIPLQGQKLQYDNNAQCLISKKENYSVMIYPVKDILTSNDEMLLGVYIYNNTNRNVNFSTEYVLAYCCTDKKNIRIYTYDEAVGRYAESFLPQSNGTNLLGLDPNVAAAVHQQDIEHMQFFMSNLDKSKAAIKEFSSKLLKRTTVPPNGSTSGCIMLSPMSELCGNSITFEIGDLAEIHTFKLDLKSY